MNGKQVLDRLDFHDDRVLDHKVHSVTQFNGDTVINYRKGLFGFELHPTSGEFVRETHPIRSFEQPWPEFGMNVVRGAENDVRDARVNQMNSVPSVRIRVLRGVVFLTQDKDRH